MPINFARQKIGTGTGEMCMAHGRFFVAISHARESVPGAPNASCDYLAVNALY
jgi:hypothetical protein